MKQGLLFSAIILGASLLFSSANAQYYSAPDISVEVDAEGIAEEQEEKTKAASPVATPSDTIEAHSGALTSSLGDTFFGDQSDGTVSVADAILAVPGAVATDGSTAAWAGNVRGANLDTSRQPNFESAVAARVLAATGFSDANVAGLAAVKAAKAAGTNQRVAYVVAKKSWAEAQTAAGQMELANGREPAKAETPMYIRAGAAINGFFEKTKSPGDDVKDIMESKTVSLGVRG